MGFTVINQSSGYFMEYGRKDGPAEICHLGLLIGTEVYDLGVTGEIIQHVHMVIYGDGRVFKEYMQNNRDIKEEL